VKIFGISENFIEVYDNTLTEKECEIIISHVENCNSFREGGINRQGQFVVDHSFKQCREVPDLKFSNGDVISNIIRKALFECIDKYKAKFRGLDYTATWTYNDAYNCQKYETEDDGFKMWHSEHGPGVSSHRMLAWMFYLNNAKSGTEFMYHPTVNAKRGRCVIWPSGFSHCHRGVPNKGLKYIVTGWVSFDK